MHDHPLPVISAAAGRAKSSPWLPGVRGVQACSEAAAKRCQQSSTSRLYLLKVHKCCCLGLEGPYLMG